MPLIHCSSTLYYHLTTVPLFYLTLLSLRHCSTVPPHFTITAPLFHHTLPSLRHCSTVPPHFTITVPLSYCSTTHYYRSATAPLFLHTLLSLCHCSTVPSHFIITAPLLHCSSTVYYCYSLPVRLPYIAITRARIGTIKRVFSELPCPGAFLDLLYVHEKWKTFPNKHHTTSQDAKQVWCGTKSSSKDRKSSEVFSGNWLRGVCRTARILLYGQWSDRNKREISRPVN